LAGNDGGIKKVELDDGAFIYATPPTRRRPLQKDTSNRIARVSEADNVPEQIIEVQWTARVQTQEHPVGKRAADPEEYLAIYEPEGENHIAHWEEEPGSSELIYVPAQVAPLPNSTAFERQLLHHFIHNASRATSCHSLVQEDVCRIILPMAMENPALLSGTLVLSAIHQKTLGHPVQAMIADQKIAGLKTASLQHLRSAIAQPQRKDLSVILATVRTLCLAEVYDGDHRTKSWRAHFEGARALLDAETTGKQNADSDEPADFLRRWFSVTEGLIALTPDSIPTKIFEEDANNDLAIRIRLRLTTDNTADDEDGVLPSNIYLDEYTGCSTDLSDLFRNIGLAMRTHESRHDLAQDRTCIDYHCSMVTVRLERRIRDMITRDQVGKVVFHPKTASKLSRRQALEFALCNRAYQYSALLHIQRRLYDLPAAHPEVQEVVNIIVGCVEGVHPAEGLSPLAVLTTPVFVAGCEAFGHDRARVRRLLDVMHMSLRIPNMRRASEMLEKYWASAQCGQSLGWARFAKLHDYDFLPY
jgi:hypothetical protein